MIDDIITPAPSPRFGLSCLRDLFRPGDPDPARGPHAHNSRAIADAIDSVVDLFAGGAARRWVLETEAEILTITREGRQ